MAEQLYTIPVNDAFSADCECPMCMLYKDLEDRAIEFTLGPSYMEDDNRAITDELGFCPTHIRRLYSEKNRLGLALMMNTHMNKTIRDLKALSQKGPAPRSGFLKKSTSKSPVVEYIDKLESTCFVCQRITPIFDRYINTIFHMWKKDPDFKSKVDGCKGFCTYHYGLLYDQGAKYLNEKEYDGFLTTLNKVYFEGMDRVNGDVSWFIDKFDYRNKTAPWKNSQDALPRGITKIDHTIINEKKDV